MERIVALQCLSEFPSSAEGAFDDSNFSIACSIHSSGTGQSSCSVGCGPDPIDGMDW